MDNLQPDFLYDHIQPVRAELFQVRHLSCFIVSFSILFEVTFRIFLILLSRRFALNKSSNIYCFRLSGKLFAIHMTASPMLPLGF